MYKMQNAENDSENENYDRKAASHSRVDKCGTKWCWNKTKIHKFVSNCYVIEAMIWSSASRYTFNKKIIKQINSFI